MLESLLGNSLPIEQEDEITRKLHGEEWWYPLTCPTNSYSPRNYSVVVGESQLKIETHAERSFTSPRITLVLLAQQI